MRKVGERQTISSASMPKSCATSCFRPSGEVCRRGSWFAFAAQSMDCKVVEHICERYDLDPSEMTQQRAMLKGWAKAKSRQFGGSFDSGNNRNRSRLIDHAGARGDAVMTRDTFPKKPIYATELLGVDPHTSRVEGICFLMGYDRWVGTGAYESPIELPPECTEELYMGQNLPGSKPSNVLRRKREIGFVEILYLSGKNEALGREALIRVLKKPLRPFLQRALISLFTQDGQTALDRERPDSRKLVFGFRSKHPRETSKDRAIADFIQRRRENAPPHEKKMLKPHIKDAMGVFGATEKAIYQAWNRDKKRHPQFHFPEQ